MCACTCSSTVPRGLGWVCWWSDLATLSLSLSLLLSLDSLEAGLFVCRFFVPVRTWHRVAWYGVWRSEVVGLNWIGLDWIGMDPCGVLH